MSDRRKRMERLLLPRARAEPAGVEQPLPETRVPLPRWQTIPLDAKFPVLPAPKGEVTFVTTKMGETPFKSTQRRDFDLSDPYNRQIKADYRALFDPYLKGWFSRPSVQKQMKKQNLITDKGNVTCSVREFNDYRYYLRKKALMEAGGSGAVVEENLDVAKERKKAMLAKTKMKAEVFGVEVKYKALKARQAAQEEEAERQLEYLRRTESEEERQRRRVEEEEKEYLEALKKSQNNWNRKMEKLKERDINMRKKAEQKLVQFELESQDKLNKLDLLREQKFQELDQKRKFKWYTRRKAQMKQLEQTQRQRQRVEAEMRTLRRRYEDQMTRKLVKDEVAMDHRKESRYKHKEKDQETFARRMARVLKDTHYLTFSPNGPAMAVNPSHLAVNSKGADRSNGEALTRKASLWMVQEVLHRLGLSDEYHKLHKADHGGTMSYLNDLDNAMNVAVRRLEGVTLLGEDQEMLSRLAHLSWRRIKVAYPGKAPPTPKRQPIKEAAEQIAKEVEAQNKEEEEENTEDKEEKDEGDGKKVTIEKGEGEEEQEEEVDEQQLTESKIMEENIEENFTTGEQLAWFFPDGDDDEEREKAVKISMLVNGNIDRKLSMQQVLGDPRPAGPQRLVEEKMDEFFKSRMRMTEADALTIEAELMKFLETLKEEKLSKKELKSVLSMCIRLANHDIIRKSDPCSEQEKNPEGLIHMAFSKSDDNFRLGVDSKSENQLKGSGSIQNSRINIPDVIEEDNLESEAIGTDNVEEGNATEDPQAAQQDGEENADDGQDATENANTNKALDNRNGNKQDISDDESARSSNSRESVQDSELTSDRSGRSRRSSSSEKSHSRSERASSDSSYTTRTGSRSSSRASSQSGSDARINEKDSGHDSKGKDNKNDNYRRTPMGSSESDDMNISQNRMDADRDDGDDGGENEAPPDDEPSAAFTEDGDGEDASIAEAADTVINDDAGPEDGDAEKLDVIPVVVTESLKFEDPSGQVFLSESREQFRVQKSDINSDSVAPDPELLREMKEQKEFEAAVAKNDHVGVATHILSKIQQRERIKGVSIPQSRLLRFVAMNMSDLWKPGPDDRLHRFGQWLQDPATPDAIRSLIYNIKRRRFPPELQQSMAKAVVAVCIQDVSYSAMPLTDGLVKTVLDRFMEDLEKDQVSMTVLEKVLQSMVDEYTMYFRMDVSFNASVLVLDSLSYIYDNFTSGEFTKRGHFLPAIRNWGSMSADKRGTMECGSWGNLIHRASVIIRLDMLKAADWKNLLKLVTTLLLEHIGPDAPAGDLREMLEMMRNRMTLPKYKKAFCIDLGVNTVVTLLDALQTSKISSTTLLPGVQNTSQSACSARCASILGPYTIAESVVLLVLDKLASDMGNNKIEAARQGQIAAALVDHLVNNHGLNADDVKGPEGLDNAFDKLYDLSTDYREAKSILAVILRPYLASMTTEEEPSIDFHPPPGLTLTDDQSSSLLTLITDIFLTFVHGVRSRLARGGVKVEDIPMKIQALYTWRSLARLAKQARRVLSDVMTDHANDVINSRVKPSDSLIIERMYRSALDATGNSDVTNDLTESEDVYGIFLRGIIHSNNKPGYVPVTDVLTQREELRRKGMRNKTSRQRKATEEAMSKLGDPDDTPMEHKLREEATPPFIDRALRRELIAAARDINDCLVTSNALRQLTAKTADSLAGTAFIMEKLLGGLYNKLWSLSVGLRQGKTSPDSLNTVILGSEHCDSFPQLQLTRDVASKVVNEAIVELEGQYNAAVTMSRMVESLSRAAHGLLKESGNKAAPSSSQHQPHPILASASPLLVSQWLRSCLLAALKAITTVISGGKANSSKVIDSIPSLDQVSSIPTLKPSKNKLRQVDPDAIFLAASYVAVHNMMAKLRDTAERQKTEAGLWMAQKVAGTNETSEVGVPMEIVDRVFARLAGVMQTLSESTNKNPDENDGRVPECAADLASVIISQVTSAISYHVEIGQFPMIRINDLIKANKAPPVAEPSDIKPPGKKLKKTPSKRKEQAAADVSENNRGRNNNWSLDNSGAAVFTLCDPVETMEKRWSEILFHSLSDIVGRIDLTLKQSLEMSLYSKDEVLKDAKVRARAYTSSWLDKIRRQAISHEVLLLNGRSKARESQTRVLGQTLPRTVTSCDANTLLSTNASPAVSRRASQAKLSVRNTNVNKTPKHQDSVLGCNASNLKLSQTCGKIKPNNSGLLQYVRNMVRPVCESNDESLPTTSIFRGSEKDVSNNKSVDAISEILRAGYSVSFDLLRSFDQRWCQQVNESVLKQANESNSDLQQANYVKHHELTKDETLGSASESVSILILDVLLEQLTYNLEKQARADNGQLGNLYLRNVGSKQTKKGAAQNNPYISSYQYRRPDPYGAFYAEVVDRGRRWCKMLDADAQPVTALGAAGGSRGADNTIDVARIHSMTRELLAPGAPGAGGYTSQVASILDVSSAASVGSSSQPSSSLTQNKPGLKGRQTSNKDPRAATWRKDVHKASAAYGAENINNSWRRRAKTSTQSTGRVILSKASESVAKSSGCHGDKPAQSQQKSVGRKRGDSVPPNSHRSSTSNAEMNDSKQNSFSKRLETKPKLRRESTIPLVSSKANGREKKVNNSNTRLSSNRQPTCNKPASTTLTRNRPDHTGKQCQAKHKKTLNNSSTEALKDKSQTSNSEHGEKKPQEPRLQVIYHVTEESRDRTEEHLQKMRQLKENEEDMMPLKELELQVLLLKLLSRDLPRETTIIEKCLQGRGRFTLTSLADVTDLLSLVDHVLLELPTQQSHQRKVNDVSVDEKENNEEDDKEKGASVSDVTRLLSAACKQSEVSQRSAGAVHSLLRSIECGILPEEDIRFALNSINPKQSGGNASINAVKNQLKSSLALLVERLEEGQAPKCMTSSGWTRLAQAISEEVKKSPAENDIEVAECTHIDVDDKSKNSDDKYDDDNCRSSRSSFRSSSASSSSSKSRSVSRSVSRSASRSVSRSSSRSRSRCSDVSDRSCASAVSHNSNISQRETLSTNTGNATGCNGDRNRERTSRDKSSHEVENEIESRCDSRHTSKASSASSRTSVSSKSSNASAPSRSRSRSSRCSNSSHADQRPSNSSSKCSKSDTPAARTSPAKHISLNN